MIKISYNTRIFLKPTGLVMARIRWENKKKQCYISLGIKADAEKWNAEAQRARKNTTHSVGGETMPSRVINECIEDTLEYIDEFFKSKEIAGVIPTTEEFKEYLNFKIEAEVKKTPVFANTNKPKNNLHEVFTSFLKNAAIENNWGPHCHHKYEQMYNLITSYTPRVQLMTMDRKWLTGWKEWMINHGYHNHTTNKHYRNLKCFLRWAKLNGEEVNEDVFSFKTKLAAPLKAVIYLTMDEVEKFAAFKFPESKKYLSRARDYFIFMCCTSLRYSDMKALKIASVSDGFIDIFTQKTHDKIRVPLNKQAKDIFERYSKNNPGDLLFHAPSNQKLNDYLKEAAKEAGLDREVVTTYFVGTKRHEDTYKLHEVISCHCGRRTFVCIALSLGIPAPVVMSITGHSDYKNMMPYISIADNTAKNEMLKWDGVHDEKQNKDSKEALKKSIDGLNKEQLDRLLKLMESI